MSENPLSNSPEYQNAGITKVMYTKVFPLFFGIPIVFPFVKAPTFFSGESLCVFVGPQQFLEVGHIY